MNLTDRVREILVGELNLTQIADDSGQEDIIEWDFLSYMRIIAAIEKEFGLEITPENINNFNSVPNIVREITAARGKSAFGGTKP